MSRKTFLSRDTVLLLASLGIMGYQLITDRIHWELCLVAMAFAGIPGVIGGISLVREPHKGTTQDTTDESSSSQQR